ncbi:ATP-dependent DNA helicase, partial [Undibacterium sp. Dicai25W]|uniref:ATP-dependent DNA helicase n=1 Tax=Undibacterium sp. Dicai25W TaxID=3413034 RepID=UPI003BEF774E
RVAFDQESLDKIKRNSTTPEKIEQVVKQQIKDERNRFDKVLVGIEQSKKDGEIDNNKYYKKLSNAHQEHSNKEKFINSSKNKSSIQAKIKNKKSDESLDNKTQRLDDYVASLGLKEKNDTKDIGIVHPTNALDHTHDNSIINKLTGTKATFTENELITEYVNHYGTAGKERASNILGLAKSKLNGIENDMIAITKMDDKGREKTEFTSKALISKEYENLAVMRKQMSQDSKVHIDSKKLSKSISALEKKLDDDNRKKELSKGKQEKDIPKTTFADGQKEFINSVFNEKNATIAIGVPGAGKSFAINGASLIAHEQGFKTFGIAPTNKVAGDLGQTAIGKENAFTVQSFNAKVANGKIKLDDKSIVFMDEASMVDTRTFNDLMKNIESTNAKLVVVGDTNQISAVGTGQTLSEFMKDKDIIKHKENIVVLDEITRQKDEVSMMIAQSTSLAKEYKNGNVDELKSSGNHIKNAFDIMENNDRVNKFETTKDKYDGLVNDYMQDKNACKDKLVLASTNESVSNLNGSIQDARLKNGDLSKESISNGDKDFHVGDRIVLKENNKTGNTYSKDDEKALFKEFANTKEQKQAFKDLKEKKTNESDFKEKQKESFTLFKQDKVEQQEKKHWNDFLKSDEQKQATKEFKSGNVNEKTHKENQQVDFAKYKLDHDMPLANGYSNGDVGTVKELRNGKALVAFDNGNVSEIQVQGNEKVDLGYALTLHKSQGQTVNNSYVFMENSSINNQNLANVAFTRNRDDLQVYSTNAEFDSVKETYARQDGKQLLTDIGKEHGLEPQKPAQEQSKTVDQEQSKAISQSPKQPEMEQSQKVEPEKKQGFFDSAKSKLQGMADKFKKQPEQEQAQSKKIEPESKKDGLSSVKDAMENNTKIAQKPEQSNEMPDAIKAQKALEQQKSQSQSIQQEQAKSLNNEIAQRKATTQDQSQTQTKANTRKKGQGLSL